MKGQMMNDNVNQQHPYQSPAADPSPPPQAVQPGQGDATGGLIPYKNVPALIAYYLGLFSLFPLLGFFLAVPAFVLGIMGLIKKKRQPEVRGSVHAWIGIIMGGLFSLIWGGLIASMIVGIFVA